MTSLVCSPSFAGVFFSDPGHGHQIVTVRGFDFIECFTTTFLRAHSWLNWVDEDDDEDEVA